MSSCKLQLAEICTAATYYVGMVCVITATLYVYFVDQCHPYIWFLRNHFNTFTALLLMVGQVVTSIREREPCRLEIEKENKGTRCKEKENKGARLNWEQENTRTEKAKKTEKAIGTWITEKAKRTERKEKTKKKNREPKKKRKRENRWEREREPKLIDNKLVFLNFFNVEQTYSQAKKKLATR